MDSKFGPATTCDKLCLAERRQQAERAELAQARGLGMLPQRRLHKQLQELAGLKDLRRLRLRDCRRVRDLSILDRLPRLRVLDTVGSGVQPTPRHLAMYPHIRFSDNRGPVRDDW
ncbi:hypothetical protein ACIQUM_38450 [Amycolatopsis azurea]|uniref:hypothetical protein n=1 Tax=Amycolatopsis azurea TaxID=36819 RepID=UPI0038259F8E